MHQDAQKKEVNPLMIQSYFDGETPSDELDAISHESLSETPTWQALNELRHAVRLDAESFIDSVDSYALLSSIEDRIEREREKSPAPLHASRTAPAQQTTKRFSLKHWIPTFIGVAALLCSIPGLVQLIDDDDAPPPTVVYVADSGTPKVQCPAPQAPPQGIHADDLSSDDATVQFARRSHLKFDTNANPSQQLTIEELDFALRRLVDRIETLEKANQNNIETGKSALNTDLAEVPHKI